jgi:Type VI secretion system (T6SS), amidase effector protein 4
VASAVPSFDLLNQNYPNFVSIETVKRLMGGAINDLDAPPTQQWLGRVNGNTLTIRLSRTLNYSGVPVPKGAPGLRTAAGADHRNYAFAMQEMRGWLTGRFEPPTIDRAGGPPISREASCGTKGIIAFDIHFTDANGHLDLCDGNSFYDEVYGLSMPGTTSSTRPAACRCG